MSPNTSSSQSEGNTSKRSTGNTTISSASQSGNTSGVKRVNVTIDSERHARLSEFAEEVGLSFSALARRGAEQWRNQFENDTTSRELQPILSELDKQQQTLEEYGEQLDELSEANNELLTLVQYNQTPATGSSPNEEIKQRLEALLEKEGQMTIPQIDRQTPLNRQEIQGGLTQLRNEFVITTTETGDGTQKWRCR